jgi:hypothetical protein
MSTFDDEFDRIDRDTRDEPKEEPERQEAKPPTARTLKKRAAYARRWRQRQREAAKAKLASLTPADIWARNRALLTADQLADLTERQYEWAGLAMCAAKIAASLPLPKTKFLKVGVQPDGSEGFCYPDQLYLDIKEFNTKTNPNGFLVVRLTPEEFTQLHAEGTEEVLRLFQAHDEEHLKYGMRVRFRTAEVNDFVDALAEYLTTHDDENFDEAISQQILAEAAKRSPNRFQKKSATPHTTVTPEDALRAAELRLQGEYKRALGGLYDGIR